MVTQCPNCGQVLRPGAKFCSNCRQAVAGAATPQPAGYTPSPSFSPPAQGPAQKPALMQQAGQAAQQAVTAAAPVARAAGSAAWRASRTGMGWFARLVTLGGRAAYTEVFDPSAAAEGQVTSHPTSADTPAPFEMAAMIFALSWVLLPLLFLVRDGRIVLASFVGALLLLLGLNFAGLRWPVFTKLTFGKLFGRHKGGKVPEMQFQVHDAQKGVINVRIVGTRRQAVQPVLGYLVRVYGMPVPGRNEIRAWKLDVYGSSGQPLDVMSTARLLPLSAMLLAPVMLWFIVWIVLQMVRLAST